MGRRSCYIIDRQPVIQEKNIATSSVKSNNRGIIGIYTVITNKKIY